MFVNVKLPSDGRLFTNSIIQRKCSEAAKKKIRRLVIRRDESKKSR